MPWELVDFEGGNDKQRDHLNIAVDNINDLKKRVEALEQELGNAGVNSGTVAITYCKTGIATTANFVISSETAVPPA